MAVVMVVVMAMAMVDMPVALTTTVLFTLVILLTTVGANNLMVVVILVVIMVAMNKLLKLSELLNKMNLKLATTTMPEAHLLLLFPPHLPLVGLPFLLLLLLL